MVHTCGTKRTVVRYIDVYNYILKYIYRRGYSVFTSRAHFTHLYIQFSTASVIFYLVHTTYYIYVHSCSSVHEYCLLCEQMSTIVVEQ